jgi:hypothetical protein
LVHLLLGLFAQCAAARNLISHRLKAALFIGRSGIDHDRLSNGWRDIRHLGRRSRHGNNRRSRS